jgi:prepilin-type N-terminal cleavage/methylation domain-containing protein
VKVVRAKGAFTLIELLVVIAIIGLIAAISVPAIKNFGRSDAMLAATRQMLDDVSRARQLAMTHRTTVYMVFLPSNFWGNATYPNAGAFSRVNGTTEAKKLPYLYDNQLTSYAFVTLRSAGDQPGQPYARYLSSWKTLPEGTYIAPQKFMFPSQPPLLLRDPFDPNRVFNIYGFNITNNIPFPSEDTAFIPNLKPYIWLPYIAFNYLGQLVYADGRPLSRDEFIPLARGTIAPRYDVNKVPLQLPPTVIEKPPGNTFSNYNVIHIDWLTGRARVEHPEVQ